MERLDIVSPDASPEDVKAALLGMAKVMQQGVDKLGVNLLRTIQSSVVQTVSTTAYAKMNDFQSSVKTSGGLIVYFASLGIEIVNQTALVKLEVDGDAKLIRAFGNSGTGQGQLIVMWFGLLNAGDHLFKLYGRVNGGSWSLNTVGQNSDAYIVELLKG